MPELERSLFIRGDKIAEFEVGYRTPENGANYLLNPSTRRFEFIWGEELRDAEGTEIHSVETRSGMYDVDGTLRFAKLIAEYERKDL